MFVFEQLFQISWEFDKEINALFINFNKVYDSIQRGSMINIFQKVSVP